MILGIGTDIVNIERIEKDLAKFGEKFEQKLFTQAERDLANERAKAGKHAKAATLAKRFAAKEAFLKALGTGFASGISWQDMEVVADEKGKPFLKLSGRTLEHLQRVTSRTVKPRIDLSLADDYPFAIGYVVISAG